MLAFSHIYKSGGTSLKWILRNAYGHKHIEINRWKEREHSGLSYVKHSPKPIDAEDLQRVLRYFPYVKSIQSHELKPYSDLERVVPGIRYFTFIRDPLKQTASWFQYLINIGKRTDLSFEEYIKTEFPRNMQTKMIAGVDDLTVAKKIIKQKKVFIGITENFDESFVLLKKLIAPELRINYVRMGTAENNNIAKKLLSNKNTRDMIMDATQVDRKLYEYALSDIYPQYKVEYGYTLEEDMNCFNKNQENFRFNKFKINLCRIQSKVIYDRILVPLYRKGYRI